MKLKKGFFERAADIVAKELLGKILVVKGKKAKIVETEAYFGKEDPASWASKGENKVSKMMIQTPGKILVYNVHMYKMLNFVTGKEGEAGAVLIRAVEPINFKARCNGPGLLTLNLGVDDTFHGSDLNKNLFVLDNKKDFKIIESKRIGITKDLDKPLRFYIQENKHISRK